MTLKRKPQAAPRRFLVVNADDFGLSPGVSRGILHAHVCGIVTSTSLMVRPPFAKHAVQWAKNFPRLDLGLHLDLAEWIPDGGQWKPLYRVCDLEDPAQVSREIDRQLSEFRRLVGRIPTHLDSHQHVHLTEPVRTLLEERADELRIHIRHISMRYCGKFYGHDNGKPHRAAITPEALVAAIEALPPGRTELACHPGMHENLDSLYRDERVIELESLCDRRVQAVIRRKNILLCPFSRLPVNSARLSRGSPAVPAPSPPAPLR